MNQFQPDFPGQQRQTLQSSLVYFEIILGEIAKIMSADGD